MPRHSRLSSTERVELLAFPLSYEELVRHYTLSESELSVIRQHRGAHNRLGFAVQLSYLRYPGLTLTPNETPPSPLLAFIAGQLNIAPEVWPLYAQRAETRREHLLELQTWLGIEPFGVGHFRNFVRSLAALAQQTDRGVILAKAFMDGLRAQHIIVPTIEVIERVCQAALILGTRQMYEVLSSPLSDGQRGMLDGLLAPREGTNGSGLMWLRQPPGAPSARHILTHIERLKAIQELALPEGMERLVHQNRLAKIAREGGQMTGQHLSQFGESQRFATLIAIVLEARATLIDEIIDLHDKIMTKLFTRAKRHHKERFHDSGKDINNKLRLYSRIGRALVEAKTSGLDPYTAIETILPWETFAASVAEAEKLSQSESFDHLSLITEGFNQLRRYTPAMLEVLILTAAPSARDVLAGVEVVRGMNARSSRKVPEDAPTSFVRDRWVGLVYTEGRLDRRFYEMCVLSELKNSLRSGDIWVRGSRQFRDFEEYLMPPPRFAAQREQQELGLDVDTDCERFLGLRLTLLEREVGIVERLAASNELPDATITEKGRLKIAPLDKAVPEAAAELLSQVYRLIPHLKITDLLTEVDNWVGFTRHFTHLKSGGPVSSRSLLLTGILADGINLGLAKMTESCPGTSHAQLAWLQAWYIRDETYTAALAELVNFQFRQPLAAVWGDGTTSSSDGQNFRAGSQGRFAAQVNPKYGSEPGVQFYTHISDQYAPFHTKVISATVRDATHVLDGLLYHESDLRIKEHYTDTAGFTDHVFALMHLLGFHFAPRIRDLSDKRLYVLGNVSKYPILASMIGGGINAQHIRTHWDEILRLAASIKQGTVTASLMLRKLGSYPRQNGLAMALRELGRIERTLFTLGWMQSVELRRRVQVGLNKGEARNALARAVFFNKLGEIRDRSFENQRYHASGLNLVVAAIVLWNTVYIERSVMALRAHGQTVDEDLLQYLSPLGWEHISLTGDYTWREDTQEEAGQFRPLRPFDR